MSPSRYCRLALASAITCAPLAPLSAPVAASGDDGSGAVVLSAGNPGTSIALPARPAPGQTATTVTVIDVSVTAGGSTIDFDVELRATVGIDAIATGGGYATAGVFDSVAAESEAANVGAARFDALTGVTYRETIEADGFVASLEPLEPGRLSEEQRLALASVADTLRGVQAVYPDEPVGLGARWTVEQPVAASSFPVTAAYHYELTAIGPRRFTVSVSYSSEFDATIEGVAATGTVSGLGSIDGSIDNPLDVSFVLGQTTDSTAGGRPLHVAVTVSKESTPG